MGSGAKIMVVDDDPDMRETLQIILEAAGHTVVTAADGEECLARLKTECPDLLILDLLMPKMDGFAVCKELKDPRRAKYAKMPIIILTSVREDASQRRYELETGVRLDVDDYVEKPIESKVLQERVAKILNKIGKA
ncbi:MAG: response regulator [Proteobacteria bacterium]|nr:response regulator [Pseudomonadota bacterium]MCG2829498.1 response regulator [Desulfobacteraceae bacterium]MBU3980415.1 response regulator [Pseudomonadota bacterium]MBU4013238.1 response regulator [Pseudomonadota bacterium]MBU4067873.1 response regulator [Pseudomonadota bacterium]